MAALFTLAGNSASYHKDRAPSALVKLHAQLARMSHSQQMLAAIAMHAAVAQRSGAVNLATLSVLVLVQVVHTSKDHAAASGTSIGGR